MKRKIVLTSVVTLLIGVGTVYAAGSPYGKIGNYELVAINMDREKTNAKGLFINGEIYVPVSEMQKNNKVAYFYDSANYQTHLFFGGGKDSNDSFDPYYRDNGYQYKSKSELAAEVMKNIPYDDDRYHSGMMHQDIINIASFAKAFLSVTEMMDNAVQSKASINRDPNLELIKQGMVYRGLPLELMDDRMKALANELGDQIGRSEERDMDDVRDNIQEAIKYQNKAFRVLEDWLESSDEDDLDDYRDYVEEVRDNLYEAVETLTGEVLDKPGTVNDDSLKKEVEKWLLNS
ncbi:hypothetical protein ACFYU8_18350 [Brevibacillus sp. NPDC003359]|uniref:hypothetical protein n=1 Tax=unclassified Brevibacillus TaxID=2684853 RepID=UPI0036D04A6B